MKQDRRQRMEQMILTDIKGTERISQLRQNHLQQFNHQIEQSMEQFQQEVNNEVEQQLRRFESDFSECLDKAIQEIQDDQHQEKPKLIDGECKSTEESSKLKES
eukprot:TRINITY_DN7676_c0_g3_i1.p3 TRINITY_DN7676_c0_g3~~TRINITY_DN7676_c0_g3_i1.p3  ORF type:complete len:104 (+),score=8.24 TRINITY_DN7676_c0_g3_i1:240-551(+)